MVPSWLQSRDPPFFFPLSISQSAKGYCREEQNCKRERAGERRRESEFSFDGSRGSWVVCVCVSWVVVCSGMDSGWVVGSGVAGSSRWLNGWLYGGPRMYKSIENVCIGSRYVCTYVCTEYGVTMYVRSTYVSASAYQVGMQQICRYANMHPLSHLLFCIVRFVVAYKCNLCVVASGQRVGRVRGFGWSTSSNALYM